MLKWFNLLHGRNVKFRLQIGSYWPQMGQIWAFLRSVSVHFGAGRQNVLKLIWKSPRFVPFRANMTQFGWQIWHPALQTSRSMSAPHRGIVLMTSVLTWLFVSTSQSVTIYRHVCQVSSLGKIVPRFKKELIPYFLENCMSFFNWLKYIENWLAI